MKNKILIISLVVLFIILVVNINMSGDYEQKIIMEENKQLFQGPVPEGYDEEHFRETGETIKLKE